MLLRIILETRWEDFFIISVYKTSKMGKYWHRESEE